LKQYIPSINSQINDSFRSEVIFLSHLIGLVKKAKPKKKGGEPESMMHTVLTLSLPVLTPGCQRAEVPLPAAARG